MSHIDWSFKEMTRKLQERRLGSDFLGSEKSLSSFLYSIYNRLNLDKIDFSNSGTSKLFIDRLSRENAGSGSWESGWSFYGYQGDYAIVVRDGVRFRARTNEVRRSSDLEDAHCRVLVPKEQRFLNSGFYVALGNVAPQNRLDLRLYWHLSKEGAPKFVKFITRACNKAGLQFIVKVLNDPSAYVRADSGVLYLRSSEFMISFGIVSDCYTDVAGDLNAESPLFTKQIALGLSFALDPLNGRSFGQHIVDIFARYIEQRAAMQETASDKTSIDLKAALSDAGINPAAPYLLGREMSPVFHSTLEEISVAASLHLKSRPTRWES